MPRVRWLRGCVQYQLSPKAFSELALLDEEQVLADVAQAFATWNAVDCDREPMRVEALQAPADEDHAGFDFDRLNESVISAHDRSEWQELDYDPDALAMTLLFVDPTDGEIYDADLELNAGAGKFTHCTERCDPGEVDLRNTLQHETGHYLGLGHSDVDGATMAPYTPSAATDKITLETDDERGYCALQMPAPDDQCDAPVYPSVIRTRRASAGCAVHAPDAERTPANESSGRVTGLLLALAAYGGWRAAAKRRRGATREQGRRRVQSSRIRAR